MLLKNVLSLFCFTFILGKYQPTLQVILFFFSLIWIRVYWESFCLAKNVGFHWDKWQRKSMFRSIELAAIRRLSTVVTARLAPVDSVTDFYLCVDSGSSPNWSLARGIFFCSPNIIWLCRFPYWEFLPRHKLKCINVFFTKSWCDVSPTVIQIQMTFKSFNMSVEKNTLNSDLRP